MRLQVEGAEVFAATGGRPFDPGLRLAVFLHGAGLDHSVWALHTRWFAHHGWSVLAPDLPGHGRSGGAPLRTIDEMVDWTMRLVREARTRPDVETMLIGHSMGSLVALETAASYGDRISSIALIATAANISVSPELLAAAEANDHGSIDMVTLWGLGLRAGLGGSLAPGLWMAGNVVRLLERAAPGVLYADLKACNGYKVGLASARDVRVPATLILGERDLMTPLKGGKALAAALPKARVTVLKGAGHMLMAERPDEVLAALTG